MVLDCMYLPCERRNVAGRMEHQDVPKGGRWHPIGTCHLLFLSICPSNWPLVQAISSPQQAFSSRP